MNEKRWFRPRRTREEAEKAYEVDDLNDDLAINLAKIEVYILKDGITYLKQLKTMAIVNESETV